MARYVYGICNVAFYNLRPEGDLEWYGSRAERDAAIEALRERAIVAGLSKSAAEAGIYPVRRYVASESGAAWLRDVQSADRPGVRWHEAGEA